MIPLLVFYVHAVALAAAFTREWQNGGVIDGILAVFFVGLNFFVGWSIASFILKLLIDQEGLGGGFDRDALALLLLTVGEAVFYTLFLRNRVAKRPAVG